MPIMEINILPLGTKDVSVSKYIKKALGVLTNKDNIQYQVTAMGTIIETRSLNTLLKIAGEMHRSVLADVMRVVTNIRIDERRDKKSTIQKKLESVSNTVEKVKPEVNNWLVNSSEKMLKKLGIQKKQRVLDFGCRSGNYTIPAAKIVGKEGIVYGVDKDKNRLDRLQKNADAKHLKNIVLIKRADWRKEIVALSIDRVILFDVLHPGYFPQKSSRIRLLNKIYEILKPEGIVFILPTHVKELRLSLKDFVKEVETCGFKMGRRITETLVHDNNLEKCGILTFRKV
jgi:uncharacterized protein (TIGR00106 family)